MCGCNCVQEWTVGYKGQRLVIPNGNTIPLDVHRVCNDSNSVSVDITMCPNGLLVKKGKDW